VAGGSKGSEKEGKKRVRRSPEEAHALILAAAKKVLSEKGPDAAGLKDVAREAGVSHALVSHYFGTFDQLVEKALEEHVNSIRAGFLSRLPELSEAGPESILDYYFGALTDPAYGRLAVWALLSGRLDAEDFFPRRQKGMKVVADAIEAHYGGEGGAPFTRDDLELMILLVTAAGFGFAAGRDVFFESMGHKPGPARDKWFREQLGRMIRRYMLRDESDEG